MNVLTWRSGSVRALDASGPGSILTRDKTYLLGICFSCHVFLFCFVFFFCFVLFCFFSNYYLITEYIAGFKLFIVINTFDTFDCHLQKMFSINPTAGTHARLVLSNLVSPFPLPEESIL